METAQLTNILYVILSFSFLMYVLLDGFDLGAGILVLLANDEKYRETAMESILGVWHANQTWLIVFGAMLFGAFPAAYGLILSALYVPVILMLAGLILRGIGLEFYHQAQKKSRFSLAFGVGSLVSAMAQGFGVGALLSGLAIVKGEYIGGVMSWVCPFSILIGLGLPVFYVLLGATRLMNKTEGPEHDFSNRAALTAAYLALPAALLVVLWALIGGQPWTKNWFSWPGFFFTLLPLVLGALTIIPLVNKLRTEGDTSGFATTVLMICLLGFGIAASLWPFVAPPGLTLAAAAAAPVNQKIVLTTLCIMLPLIIIYNFYMYRVFRGKAKDGEYGGYA